LHVAAEQFWSEYTKRIGRRVTLIEKPNYDCIFLERVEGKARCRIYPVRPKQCRTWPFWKLNLASPDTWNDQVHRCPGINRGPLHEAQKIQEQVDGSPC